MVMKSKLISVVFATVMAGSVIYATDMPQNNEADEVWNEYFKMNTVEIYKKATDSAIAQGVPALDKNFAFKDTFGWGGAITNLSSMLEQYVAKGQPLPKVDLWPFRGTVKKYNKVLMSRVNANIKEQEIIFKESMQ